ncbi:tyrosine-protein kinase HCK-like [Babylonia areolata]|uniref:tyrosine-protein kinase HCK-like n=1 Tax=Babylonia areolata TaxID=304850 RepID=UPI003FD01B0F
MGSCFSKESDTENVNSHEKITGVANPDDVKLKPKPQPPKPPTSEPSDSDSVDSSYLEPVVKPQSAVKVTTLPKKAAVIVRAVYSYDARDENDLSFEKGDRMEVDETTQSDDWWLATHLKTGKKGYIPYNYVSLDDNSPKSQDWWFDVDHKEATKKLLLPGNPMGTFLVRESDDQKSYALSVRDIDAMGEPWVRHYKVVKVPATGEYYIKEQNKFSSLVELIDFYANEGLYSPLLMPCPRTRPVVHFKELEVGRELVKLDKHLGSGRFGEEVWKGKLRDVLEVAVKILQPGSMKPEKFLEEARIMNKLRHDRLVQLLAVCSKEEPIWMVTELMVNGSLLDYLRKDKGSLVKFPVVVDMAAQIAEGMAYLEQENFIHNDLRALNILVGKYHDIKVANFGLAAIVQQNQSSTEMDENKKFPLKWLAPEAAYDRKFSIKSDVWSFGVLLYELVTLGGAPYPGMSPLKVLEAVDKGYRMPQPTEGAGCTDAYYGIMLKCWDSDRDKRPTFAFLHSFFDDFFVNAEGDYETFEDE